MKFPTPARSLAVYSLAGLAIALLPSAPAYAQSAPAPTLLGRRAVLPVAVATDPKLDTIVIGIVKMVTVETLADWSGVMATTVLALLPPIVVVVAMQRWFVAGLTEGEK